MRFHVAAVPVHGGTDAERALNAFLGSHRVLGVERHRIADGARSAWAICVTCTEGASPAPTGPNAERGSAGRKERIDDARDHRDDDLGFRLAGAQTQIRRSAPDQTAVASGGDGCRRTPQGPRRASGGSRCAVERSPGPLLSGSRTEPP